MRSIALLALCLLIPMAIAVAVFSLNSGSARQRTSAPAAPTYDPRLVLRAHAVPFQGVLMDGMHIRGTLYPGFPGPNTLTVSVEAGGQGLASPGQLEIVAEMPGMGMIPSRGVLLRRDRAYRGLLQLPMFGTYRVKVALHTPVTRFSGVITITLPLSLPGSGT